MGKRGGVPGGRGSFGFRYFWFIVLVLSARAHTEFLARQQLQGIEFIYSLFDFYSEFYILKILLIQISLAFDRSPNTVGRCWIIKTSIR